MNRAHLYALKRLLAAAALLVAPAVVSATIEGGNDFKIDFSQAKEAGQRAKWSDPDHIAIDAAGLGWGDGSDQGSRDLWLETAEPMAVGLSWRPTYIVSLRATINHRGVSGQFYARYGADGKHWTTWQPLEEAAPDKKPADAHEFTGTLRVPYKERARYDELRMKYARREDVPWASDEEALVGELMRNEPKFFDESPPFIGYLQFLYEGELHSGQRVTGMHVEASWDVSGIHFPPKDENAAKGRDVPWRFKAP